MASATVRIFGTMEGSEREVINLEEEWDPGLTNRSDIVSSEERLSLVGTADNPIAFWPAMNYPGSAIRRNSGSNSQEKQEWPNLAGIADNPIALSNPAEISRLTGIDLDDPEVLAAIMDDDCFIVDVESHEAQVVDLSSSDDDDSGEADHIAEEQVEIVTTLSREDSLVFAEVMKVIKEGGDLRKFKVDELKTYLRHHGLRMCGAKFELLTRIQEHRRIKDPGRAEEIYPRASFSINCKGDVCHGDVVLFLQTEYNMPFDYEMRCASGPSLGKRWVAGKVVSESYGAGKQQHTFTIEVLWSQGIQPFYCMRPVKIKGRNLYRMVTMRQPWSNEAERQKVLDEKHGRGAAARAIRRAVKDRHKSKGKSRADARLHPYGPESSRAPQQSAGIHTRSTFHQGSSSTTTLPLHHNAFTERMVYETFNPGRPRTSFTDTQDSERRVPGPAHYPPPKVHETQSFHREQDRDSERRVPGPAHYPPPKVHETQSFHREQDRDSERRVPGPAHYRPPPQVHETRSFHREQDRDKRAPPKQRRINSQHHAILCSNTKCEQAGALQCITRSCGSCCYKTTAKGVCQRHR